MPSCHMCGLEADEGFKCIQCGEFTCFSCGDSSLCNNCLDEDVFLVEI